MSLFGFARQSEVDELYAKIANLQQALIDQRSALNVLEARHPPKIQRDPIRVGFDWRTKWLLEITHEDAILKILDHLGLELKSVDAVPAKVELVKRKK